MRIALISDIHANLVALETVLADLAKTHPDQIICLGDVAEGGPQPRQVITRLRALDLSVVMGNHDAELLNPLPSRAVEQKHQIFDDIFRWCLAQLGADALNYLRTFRASIELPLESNTMLLCYHGSPKSNTDIVADTTSEVELTRMLAGCSATVLAGGHSHAQMFRSYRDMLIINPGSVGLPWEYLSTDCHRNSRWAGYAVVHSQSDHLSVELRRVPLDLDAVRRAAFASGMPHADWWMAQWG